MAIIIPPECMLIRAGIFFLFGSWYISGTSNAHGMSERFNKHLFHEPLDPGLQMRTAGLGEVGASVSRHSAPKSSRPG